MGNIRCYTTAMQPADLARQLQANIASVIIGKQTAGAVGEFKVGVRREMWIYLLAAVIAVTAIEWLTYHRRVTV